MNVQKKEDVYSNEFKKQILDRLKAKYEETSVWTDENGVEWKQTKMNGWRTIQVDTAIRRNQFELNGRDITFPQLLCDDKTPAVFKNVIGHSQATFKRFSGIEQTLLEIGYIYAKVKSHKGKEYQVLIHDNCILDNKIEEIDAALESGKNISAYVTFVSGQPELIQVEEIEVKHTLKEEQEELGAIEEAY